MQEKCREGILDKHCRASRSLLGEAGQTCTWHTDSFPELLVFCYLMGPSLVIRRDSRKVAMVARSRVLGKVLR